MGRMGMRFDDFMVLYPEEFAAAAKAYSDGEQARQREDWERMRLLATITIQPHLKSKLTPHKLLPFPWDNKPKAKTPEVDREEAHKRFDRLKSII